MAHIFKQMMKSETKARILFVGSFAGKNGTQIVGGQRFACTTILESSLSEKVDWIKLDSTGKSDTLTPFYLRLLKAFKRALQLFYQLLTKKIDTVLIFSANGFSFLEKGFMARMAKAFGKKVIFAPRGGPITDDLSKPGLRRYIVKTFKKVDYVICQSKWWQERFISLDPEFTKDKFVVIKNWIDTASYTLNPNETVNEKLEFNILYLAWIEKLKGIHDLIDAMPTIVDEFKNVKLYIAGDGKETAALKRKIEKYQIAQNVEFSGWVLGDRKSTLLQKANLFVLPSHSEGSPNALKEAMASGIPSIATRVGAIPEIIVDNFNGLMYDPGNVEQLAEKIKYLIKNPDIRKRLGENGMKTIREEHDIAIAVGKLKKILL